MWHSGVMDDSFELFDLEPSGQVDAVRVLVDVDLPHLDHLLDYVVPEELSDVLRPGVSVKVPLSGRIHMGWVIERVAIDRGQRVLHPVDSCVSTVPVLDRQSFERAQYIAQRHGATTSQVLSLMIPTRHVGAEKERDSYIFSWDSHNFPSASSMGADAYGALAEQLQDLWAVYEDASTLLSAVTHGHAARAVWTALPGYRDEHLASLAALNFNQGKQGIFVFATQFQAQSFWAYLCERIPNARVLLYHSDLPAYERYGTYLDILAGQADIVVGTRSAAWLPAPRLGLLFLWDDGDDRLREHRAPRVDALDVCVSRAHLVPCTLIVGAWARSVKAQALVSSGWAQSVTALREFRRAHMPRIHVPDIFDIEREGISATSQIPPSVQRQIRAALTHGPVLVQVPISGYVPRIACQNCRSLARCPHCQGQLSVTSSQTIRCLWCERVLHTWKCPQCSATQVRALRIGSARTGEMLGKVFPGVPVLQSRAGHVITESIQDRPCLVVATPGVEPEADKGYQLVVILDPDAVAQRPELWAPEESLRRWMNAFALLSPHGKGIVAGAVDPRISQALIRWDPSYLSEFLLNERIELGFFPAMTIVALEGQAAHVRDIVLALGREVLASMTLSHRDTVPSLTLSNPTHSATMPGAEPFTDLNGNTPTTPDTDVSALAEKVRTLIRTTRQDTPSLLEQLRTIQQRRSAHKDPLVKITVNPPELFQ